MKEAVHEVLALRAQETGGNLTRIMRISFAVHVGTLVLVLFVPRDWLFRTEEPAKRMTISLGASPGPRSTGMTPIGARPVDTVAPPPPRPAPIKPAVPKKDLMTVPDASLPKPPAKPAETPKPAAPPTPPPNVGQQMQTGTSRAETGAKGEGTGISVGGGGGTEATLDADFCCPEYISKILGIIESFWQQVPSRGLTVYQFKIDRAGNIYDLKLEKSSGSGILDRSAERALLLAQSRKLPLPKEYTADSLLVHLNFQHGSR